MSDEHDHSHPHEHPAPDPAMPEDAGTQALSEALQSSFTIVKVVMVALVVCFIFSGFFKVGPQERAIRLHFGKPVGVGNQALLLPGLHWGWPPPIDEVKKIPYAGIQKILSTTGWYFTTPEKEFNNQEDFPGMTLNPAVDGYAITADGNIVHTRATLYYRVSDPVNYELNFTSATNAVRNALDNALLHAAARFTVDEIVKEKVTAFNEAVQKDVTDLVAEQGLGIAVEQCIVQSIPPRQLKPAFDSVLTALSVRDKVKNDALSYQNKTLGTAEADAAAKTNSAFAENVRLVAAVRAEAESFNKQLPRFKSNPQLFMNILLAQQVAVVLTNVQDKIFLPERADGEKREVRLQLSREPVRPPTQ